MDNSCVNFFYEIVNKNSIKVKGLAMIFASQETPLISFGSKHIYIYSKTNNKIPIILLK